MKKRIFLSIILILVVLFTSFSYATENEGIMLISEEEGVAIPEEWRRDGGSSTEQEIKVISESYSMFDENPSLQDAVIDGNLFAFGTNISLNNVSVYGDVFIAGQNITLSNVTVYGTGFVAGETVNMNNTNFAGNLFNASSTFNFTGVAQDMFAAAENLTINEGSFIAREIFVGAGNVNLDGCDITKNAHISTDKLTIGANATIGGNLNYSSKEEANIATESQIGTVNFDKIEVEEKIEETSAFSLKTYNVVTIAIKSIFVCGFIFLFAKGFMEKQKVQNVATYTAISTIKGLGWSVIIPVIGMLLLFTGVSIGLSIVVFIAYFVIFWASVPVVAITITSNIKSKREYNAWRAFGYALLVSIIIAILKQISVIGGFVTIIVGLAGMGIVMSAFKKTKKEKKTETIEAEVIE